MATVLTNSAITDYKEFTKRRIAYARYLAGGTWHTVNVLDVSTTSSGVVEIAFKINATDAGRTAISRVQLYSTAGELWADKMESLSLTSVAEGFTYVFQFKIQEKEVSG